MKRNGLILIALMACTAGFQPARAQAPATAASTPSAKPPPRALSPNESREVATTPGSRRPEDPVIPQINIPLGRTPPPPVAGKATAARHGQTSGGIDDRVARCEAQSSSAARATCRDRLVREGVVR